MNDAVDEKIKQSLASEKPDDELERIVVDLKNRNLSRSEVYEIFHSYYQMIDDRDEEETLENILDRISGWCVGSAALFRGEDLPQ